MTSFLHIVKLFSYAAKCSKIHKLLFISKLTPQYMYLLLYLYKQAFKLILYSEFDHSKTAQF